MNFSLKPIVISASIALSIATATNVAHAIDNSTINIASGHKANNFGDVAANIRMAMLLRKQIPSAKIRILVEQEVEDKFKILVPSYNPKKVTSFMGIHVYPPTQTTPNAQWGLVFSASPYSQSIPSRMKNNNQILMWFPEFACGDQHIQPASQDLSIKLSGNQSTACFLEPNKYGLYISPTKPTPGLSREQLFRWISQKFSLQLNPAKTIVGYAYAQTLQRPYLQAVLQKAEKDQTNTWLLFVDTQASELYGLTIPTNVKLVSHRIPFEITPSVIAHSNIPVLVTGDVSVSLAIEYEKPFIYQEYDWKPLFAVWLRTKLNMSHNKVVENVIGIPLRSSAIAQPSIETFLSDTNAQQQLVSSIRLFRRKQSLVDFVSQFISTFSSKPSTLSRITRLMAPTPKTWGPLPPNFEREVKAFEQRYFSAP